MTCPRALIVEDDPVTRKLLEGLLDGRGCAVDSVGDGEQAIEYLDRNRYGVVLLDIVLPKKSGTEVMEHLAATQPRMLRRVIVVSGLNVGEIRELFPSVCQALPKPVMPYRLLHAVDICLGRSHEQLTAV